MSGNKEESQDSLNFQLIMEGFYYNAEIAYITEIVKNNLYFAVLEGEDDKALRNNHDTFYFSVDQEMVYHNYYFDFGPLNISCVYKYCCKLNKLLEYSQGLKRIVHYTTNNSIKRVNAAFLIGCYAIIYLNMDSKEIYRLLLNSGGSFKLYIDASQGVSQYTLRLSDCLQAVQKALNFNFFNIIDFNVTDYDHYNKLQNGDMNWLVPRKFLAFIGPSDNDATNGHSPDFYLQYFLENDIQTVIRLNNKVYDASVFIRVGIVHHDLFFPDGTVPTKDILIKFLDISERAPGAIAVHCKAGLGRTGSLIGAYIMKHYHMSAREAIAWMRICRPGSVIGQQQGWLEKLEGYLWKQGNHYRLQHFGEADRIPHHEYGVYSIEWPVQRQRLIEEAEQVGIEEHSSRNRGKAEIVPYNKYSGSGSRGKGLVEKLANQHSSSGYKTPSLNLDKKREIKTHKPATKVSRDEREMSIHQSNLYDALSKNVKPKSSRPKQKSEFEEEHKVYKIHNFNNNKPQRYTASGYEYFHAEDKPKKDHRHDNKYEVQVPQMKARRNSVQSTSRDKSERSKAEPKSAGRSKRLEIVEQTQGDKLNQIKAKSSHQGSSPTKRATTPTPANIKIDEYGSKRRLSFCRG